MGGFPGGAPGGFFGLKEGPGVEEVDCKNLSFKALDPLHGILCFTLTIMSHLK
jgi:hypothetical protein